MSIKSNFPAISPSLLLDFSNTKKLDPRITFTRSSTATYFDNNGILQTSLSGIPRFDHNPTTGESLGLLIEEQRTNVILGSATPTTQAVVSSAVAYTLSFYGTGTIVLSGTYSATVVGTGAYPTRTTLTFTPTAGALSLTISGTVQNAQLEAGSFATSYIPTVASQVTRSADAASMTGTNFSSWFNASEGTLYANATFVAPAIAGSAGVAAIGNGSSAESIAIYKSNSLSLSGDVRAAAATQASFAQSFTATACKGAIAYRINSFNFSTNAAIGIDDTNGVVPTVTSLFIGSVYSTTSFPTNGTIKNITYYPRRLSNYELQAITG